MTGEPVTWAEGQRAGLWGFACRALGPLLGICTPKRRCPLGPGVTVGAFGSQGALGRGHSPRFFPAQESLCLGPQVAVCSLPALRPHGSCPLRGGDALYVHQGSRASAGPCLP